MTQLLSKLEFVISGAMDKTMQEISDYMHSHTIKLTPLEMLAYSFNTSLQIISQKSAFQIAKISQFIEELQEESNLEYELEQSFSHVDENQKVNLFSKQQKGNNQSINQKKITKTHQNQLKNIQVQRFSIKNPEISEIKDKFTEEETKQKNLKKKHQRNSAADSSNKNNFLNYKEHLACLQNDQESYSQHKQKTNDFPIKREIVKQVQGGKQRMGQKRKSKKDKVRRIIKLNNEGEAKFQQLKQKQAEDRLFANIDFLYSIKNHKKSEQTANEWKQEPNFSKNIINNQSKRKQNQKKLEMLGFSMSKNEASLQKMTLSKSKLQKSACFPKIDKAHPKIQLMKPQPYSLYNINLKGNEIFKNSFIDI